jgi:hypothetical protein
MAKSKAGIVRTQTGYVIDAACIRRLRTHAAVTGQPAREILETLIRKHLPEYSEKVK